MSENTFIVTSLKNEYLKDIRERLQNMYGTCGYDKDGGIEIYTDYRDRELSTDTLKEIFNADDPKQKFDEMLSDWEMYYAIDNFDELVQDCKAELTEEELDFWEENEEDCLEIVREKFYFYYDRNDFNNEIDVNIMVDCGNANYDYTCDDFGYYSHRGEVPEESSMLWLANQQGKGEEFKAAVKSWYNGTTEYVDRDTYDDPFLESMIQEVENLASAIGTVTFLVKMPLFKLFDIMEIQNKEHDPNFEYEPQLNENAKSYIVLDKKTDCGLFNSWDGGGSCLEIKLDKDVELPLKYCKFAVDGCKMQGRYDVNDVYGLVGWAWKDSLKGIKKVG